MKFVLPDKLLKCVLFGTLAISPAAYALSCRYVVPELDSRPVLAANLRFNVAARSVWMWREVLDSEIGRCTLRDFPEPAALSEAQTKQMRKAWRAQNREEFFSSELASEPVIEGAILVAPEGAPPLSGLKPRNPPETNFNENKSQHAGELLGQNLSLIRREQAQALIPPTAFLNAAVRFSAHRCESAMGGRGSGVLMAPTIVLTAAHVVA